MNGLIQAVILGIIRSSAASGGAWLANNGYASGDQVQGFIGSVCFLGSLGFTIFDKVVVDNKIKNAGGK